MIIMGNIINTFATSYMNIQVGILGWIPAHYVVRSIFNMLCIPYIRYTIEASRVLYHVPKVFVNSAWIAKIIKRNLRK